MVCGIDEMHTMIKMDQKNNIELVKNTQINLKLPVRGLMPPLKLKFEYHDAFSN